MLRISGFDNLPSDRPLSRLVPDGHPTAEAARRRTVKRHLATYGYAEAVDFSFSDPDGDLGFPMI